MSDTPFTMPQGLNPPATPYQPPVSKYAPKPHKQALDELEDAVAKQAQEGQEPIQNIKGWLKKLTHRQMRQVVEELFAVRTKVAKQDMHEQITKTELPDVLDHWAWGD